MHKKLHILFLSGWYPSRVSPSNGDFVQRHAEAVATVQNVTLIHVITDKNIKRKEFLKYKRSRNKHGSGGKYIHIHIEKYAL